MPSETSPYLQQAEALRHLAQALLAAGYVFVTPTPATHRRVNARPGNAWAQKPADIFGWNRPFHAETLPSELLRLAQAADILLPCLGGFRSAVRLSTLSGMGFLHSAFPTEAADAVFFGPDTYRFVNALVAAMASLPPPRRAVDIGAGAGAGAVAIARRHRRAETIMADINPAALRLAQINADVAGLDHVQACQSDLLENLAGTFDLIVANPPYLPDPMHRLYRDGGGALGAQLSLDIVATAIERLSPGGTLLLYTGTAIIDGANPFLLAAGERLDRAGFTWRADEIDPDVFGEELESGATATADRIAVVWLAATRPA